MDLKKILLVPDSFKGTMSSSEICEIMRRAIVHHFPEAEVISIPVADGGEGSVRAFLAACGGEERFIKAAGPFFTPIDSFYGVIDGGDTAVIEMAACAGLPLAGEEKDPCSTTTFGVGQLMIHAAHNGCKKIIMGLGGSATNDGGCGAAVAAGVRFYDEKGDTFTPTGGTLRRICRIDDSLLDPTLRDMQIVTMCDIDNPLCGAHGAAHVFAPQKGASPEDVKKLDEGLAHLARIIRRDLKKDIAHIPGSGAAGGMGGGMVAFFGSSLQMGIDTVLDTVQFDRLLENADLVFSGEGKIDDQSIRGKVVIGVARRTKAHRVPLIAVVGDIGEGAEAAYDLGVTGIFSINRVAIPYKEARLRAKNDLYLTMDNFLRTVKEL